MSKSVDVSKNRTLHSGKPTIVCEKCNISFTRRNALYVHIRKFHPEQNIHVRANQVCGLCHAAFRTIPLLQEHLQKQHSVELQFENETFYCQKDFLDWKAKIEKSSKSYFVLRNISKKEESGRMLSYYLCHRSGKFKPKEGRRRLMKASGTIKSGSTCPALMRVLSETVDGISEIKVQYQSVHVGHDLEIRTLRLSKDERTTLAALLSFGVPMTKILEETKQDFSPTSRYNCLTRKDLQNIVRDFKVPKKFEETKHLNATKNNSLIYEENVVIYEDGDVFYEGEDIFFEDGLVSDVNNSNVGFDIDINNHKIQHDLEKNSIVSPVLKSLSEDSGCRKMQTINKLKELLLRIQEWDEAIPLPDLEESIAAIDACLDIASASVSHLRKSQVATSETSSKNCVRKLRKPAMKKCSKQTITA